MQSYIGAGYPVMFFNMASRGRWYDAVRPGVVDARPPPVPQLLQPAPGAEVARRPTRHFIADILDLRDDDDSDDDAVVSDEDDETARRRRRRRRRSRATAAVPAKRAAAIWTSMSPSPPSLSSNTTDDATTSPGSEQPSAEDLRLTTTTTCGHHSAGLDSCTSDSPPSDADVNYMSDHGTSTNTIQYK